MQRYMRGMSYGGGIMSRNGEPIPMDQMAVAVPSIFATEAHESRSDRFSYIPTSTVLDGLNREGFEPFMAQQAKSRIPGKSDFTKHMIRLRHRSRRDTDGQAHEIILINAHDGTSSYQMISGVFRFVCANGLFTGDKFDEVKVRHTGDAVGQVIEGAYTVLDDAPRVMDAVDHMRGRHLSDRQQLAFARAAHALRFEDTDAAPVRAEQLLRPRRSADTGSDLWSTFNRTQENVIRGGLHGIATNANGQRRRTSTREVKGIDQNKALNRAMWTLAEEMGRLMDVAA